MVIGVEIIHIVCVVCVKEQQLASKANEDKNLAFKHINSQEEKRSEDKGEREDEQDRNYAVTSTHGVSFIILCIGTFIIPNVR